MIKFANKETEEHFVKAAEFAQKMGLLPNLLARISYLHNYSDRDTIATLYKDFAAHSFTFNMEVREDRYSEWQPWFAGGLIYHGPLETGERSVNHSVTLDPTNGWQVHT